MNTEAKALIEWLQRIKQKFKNEIPQQSYYKPMKAACSILIDGIRHNSKLYGGRGYRENQQVLISNCSGRFFEIAATFLKEELDT